VKTLGNEPVGLLHQLADEEHDRGGAVAADVVLGGGRTRNHHGCGVLDLHLPEEDIPVLCEFDLAARFSQ
jgi:hypothetical protein